MVPEVVSLSTCEALRDTANAGGPFVPPGAARGVVWLDDTVSVSAMRGFS